MINFHIEASQRIKKEFCLAAQERLRREGASNGNSDKINFDYIEDEDEKLKRSPMMVSFVTNRPLYFFYKTNTNITCYWQ